MTNKLSLVEHKRVVVNKDGKEWLSVQRLHYTEDKVELVMIRPGDKRLELVLSEEEARTLIDAVGRALCKKEEKPIVDMEEWISQIGTIKPPPLKTTAPYVSLWAEGAIKPLTEAIQESSARVRDVVGEAYESSKTEN